MDLLPNETIIFQWLLFMTALMALHYGVFRPVFRLLEERRDRTDGERKKTEQLAARAERLLEQCSQGMNEARVKGIAEREVRLREGEDFQQGEFKKIRAEIQRDLEGLRQDLDRESRNCRLELRGQAQILGREIAEKILERAVS